jgi:hypothetical protein
MRVEIFKMYYFESLFDLNVKGDAAEVLAVVLKLIHGCFSIESGKKGLEELLDSKCNRQKCWVH